MQKSPFLPADIMEKLFVWQRHLHIHPELGFQETKTTDYLAEVLGCLEGVVISRPTKTGLIAELRGTKPGKTVAFRADIDALPIQEDASLSCCSVNPGVMHACGHDGHTAMALGVAAYFSQRRQTYSGNLRFLFQHAEESPPGGARELIDHGVLDGVSAIIGCHLESKGKCGDVYVLPGPMLASTATFEIEILGKGGHAASPHQTIDPILVGAQVVTALQGIISRRRDPLHRLVLSVTQFHAGSKDNIIPQSAKLAGTVRVLDSGHSPGYNVLMKEWMEQAIKGVTSAFDAEYCFKFEEGYGALYNDADIAAIVRAAAEQTVGEKSVHVGEPNMAGDDMGYYLQKVPGCYYVVGCGQVSEDGMIYPNHHPKFQIHPDALPKGTEVAINALCALLEE